MFFLSAVLPQVPHWYHRTDCFPPVCRNMFPLHGLRYQTHRKWPTGMVQTSNILDPGTQRLPVQKWSYSSWKPNRPVLFVDLSDIAHFNKFRIKMLDRSSLIAKIQWTDFLHLLFSQCKIPYLEILFDSRFVNRFRNDHNAALHIPAQNNLSYGLSVCGSDFFYHLVVKRIVASSAERCPCLRHDLVLFHDF